jgi:orotidine-5'-phosphate decarboxylase
MTPRPHIIDHELNLRDLTDVVAAIDPATRENPEAMAHALDQSSVFGVACLQEWLIAMERMQAELLEEVRQATRAEVEQEFRDKEPT